MCACVCCCGGRHHFPGRHPAQNLLPALDVRTTQDRTPAPLCRTLSVPRLSRFGWLRAPRRLLLLEGCGIIAGRCLRRAGRARGAPAAQARRIGGRNEERLQQEMKCTREHNRWCPRAPVLCSRSCKSAQRGSKACHCPNPLKALPSKLAFPSTVQNSKWQACNADEC